MNLSKVVFKMIFFSDEIKKNSFFFSQKNVVAYEDKKRKKNVKK